MSLDRLKATLKNTSTKPGIYQMHNADGKIIYVGKAGNLKKRLTSYFRKTLDRKTEVLMSQVVDIQITITESEVDALLLESNLIKQHHPRYNVLLRDDKSYPYLFLSAEHVFPRLDFHRGTKRKKGRYFGPYPNAGAVRENLAMIQKLFKIRQCSDTFFNNRTRPCLQYQIKRCTAPCVGYVTEQAYHLQVEEALLFLEGKNAEIISRLTQKMQQAAKDKHYESAAQYRDQIIRLRSLQRQQSITGDKGDIDVLAGAQVMGQVAVTVVFIRAGRVVGHRSYFPRNPLDVNLEQAISAFISQYYLSPLRGDQMAERIKVDRILEDKQTLQTALAQHWNRKITIVDRAHAKYQSWQNIAKSNVEYVLAQHVATKENVVIKLEALQEALHLPNPVQRIECFDISHTMGAETVASCVVYGEQGALNKEYRRFNIKDITPGDDYAAMRQALMRRYTKVKTSDQVLPDLIIIDGGRGQLHQAADVLEELQITGVVLLGIAKGPKRKAGLETLFIWGHKAPMHLSPDNVAFHLLQFIRDEAHRFAITAHRKQRAKVSTQSPLELIEGVGAKRRQALLKHFGGLQQLRKASVAEIAKVPGISEALAQRIYDVLH